MKKILVLIIILFIFLSCIDNKNENDTNNDEKYDKYYQTSEYEELIITFPEIWIIDGNEVETQGTWVVGKALFTVKILIEEEPTEEMKPFAKKIALSAVKNGYRKNVEQLNKYSEDFHVRDLVGISFIDVDKGGNLKSNQGYNFVFYLEDLIEEDFEEKQETLPNTFTSSEINDLEDKLFNYFSEADVDKIHSIYRGQSLEDISIDESTDNFKKMFKLIKDISSVKYHFYTYLGKKGGIRGYYAYFKIKYFNTHIEEETEDFIRLLIIDDHPKYGIYEVFFNLIDIKKMP